MVNGILDSLKLNSLKLDSLKLKSHKEQFFTDSIDFTNVKIYPFYDLSILCSNSGKSGHCLINPVAIIVCELIDNEVVDYYLYYFDDFNRSEESTKNILNHFCNEKIRMQ